MTDVDRVSRLYGLQQSGHAVSFADCGFDQSRMTIEYAQILPITDCLRRPSRGLPIHQALAVWLSDKPNAEEPYLSPDLSGRADGDQRVGTFSW